MATSFGELRTNSQAGFGKQKVVNERVKEIENQSQMLQEANVAIASIASQTNLLAMNAAIEAAHAGEVAVGARKINETGATLNTISDKVKDSIIQIGTQVDQFKV